MCFDKLGRRIYRYMEPLYWRGHINGHSCRIHGLPDPVVCCEEAPSVSTPASTSWKELLVQMNSFPLAPTTDEPFTVWASLGHFPKFIRTSRSVGRLALTAEQLSYRGFLGPKTVMRSDVSELVLRKRWNGLEIQPVSLSGPEFRFYFWVAPATELSHKLDELGWITTRYGEKSKWQA